MLAPPTSLKINTERQVTTTTTLRLRRAHHEQHIRAASCMSRLESQWETQLRPPVEPTLVGGSS